MSEPRPPGVRVALPPGVALAPFTRGGMALPPPPLRSVSGNRLTRAGQVALAAGGVCVLAAVPIGGWYHCDAVRVTFSMQQYDDSRYGQELAGDMSGYSLAVWSYLRLESGFAVPLLVAVLATAAVALLVAGGRTRVGATLVLLGAVASLGWLALDIRAMPDILAALATKMPSGSYPTSIRPLGLGPGRAMLLALFGLLLQLNGGLLVATDGFRLVSRWRRSGQPGQGQTEGQQTPVGQFEASGATEHRIQGAAPFTQQGAHERQGQWHTQPRQ